MYGSGLICPDWALDPRAGFRTNGCNAEAFDEVFTCTTRYELLGRPTRVPTSTVPVLYVRVGGWVPWDGGGCAPKRSRWTSALSIKVHMCLTAATVCQPIAAVGDRHWRV